MGLTPMYFAKLYTWVVGSLLLVAVGTTVTAPAIAALTRRA